MTTRPKLTLSYPHSGTPPKYRVENGAAPGTFLNAADVGLLGSSFELWIVEVRKETE